MTNARFDALASKTRSRRGGRYRHTERGTIGFCLVRVIWLTAIFARRESVTIAEYRRRFGVSLRSFRRDLALLREAGFHLETADAGTYHMVCFARDSDGCSVQRRLLFQWTLTDQDDDRFNLAAWAEAVAHRFVRRWWLSVLMVLGHPPLYRDYRRRFGVSMNTFRRDKRKVRLTVWSIYAALHGQWRTCAYIDSISLE